MCLVFLALTGSVIATATAQQPELIPDRQPQQVFGGDTRQIAVTLRNTGAEPVRFDAWTRLFQLTSATAVRSGEAPWKNLQVLPGQTILESAQIHFPAVNAETRFLVQWLENTNRVFGATEVLVYPTNLLDELRILADGQGTLGVFDPLNQLKPLLGNSRVEFVDLESAGMECFQGKLAVVGPFASKSQMSEELADRIRKLAEKGAAVVWIQPPPDPGDKLQPSFYSVPTRSGTVVVVQSNLVAGLADNPQSRLNLIFFARSALHPEPVRLPVLTSQF